MKNQRMKIILAVCATVLLIPLVAMQFTDEVSWGFFDFAVMFALLFGVGLLIDFVLRKIQSPTNRVLLCSLAVVLFLLVWAEMAVGIFGSPIAGS